MDKSSINFPLVRGKDFLLTPDEIADFTCRLKSALGEEYLGIYADLSKNGLMLMFGAISLGLKVALCNVRDPMPIIGEWLKGLGVKTLLSSVPISIANMEKIMLVDDVLLQPLAQAFSNHENFISIIRTSGTTAKPKSAQISYQAHYASALAVVKHFSFTKNSSWGLSLPTHHVSGLSILFRALISGGSIVVANGLEDLVLAIRSGNVTHVSLVPAQYERLLEMSVDLSNLNAVIIGGERFNRVLGDNVYSTYGMTETSSMIYVNSRHEGHSLEHADIFLAANGELLIKGKSLFDGYLEGQKLVLPMNDQGYFATGDLAYWDKEARLKITARKSNRIILLGENMQAEEIESAIDQYPQIEKSLVMAVETSNGPILVGVIKLLSPNLDEKGLREFLSSKLSPLKIPKIFLPWPKAAPNNNKISRPWFYDFVIGQFCHSS